MNRKPRTIHLHDKGRPLARLSALLMTGALLLAAAWGLFSTDQSTGVSSSATNSLTQQMLWNPSPK